MTTTPKFNVLIQDLAVGDKFLPLKYKSKFSLVILTRVQLSSRAFASAWMASAFISVFSSDLRRFPKRGPNHMPLLNSSVVRLMHLPSVHEPKSFRGDASFDPLLDISPNSVDKQTIKSTSDRLKLYVEYVLILNNIIQKGTQSVLPSVHPLFIFYKLKKIN